MLYCAQKKKKKYKFLTVTNVGGTYSTFRVFEFLFEFCKPKVQKKKRLNYLQHSVLHGPLFEGPD